MQNDGMKLSITNRVASAVACSTPACACWRPSWNSGRRRKNKDSAQASMKKTKQLRVYEYEPLVNDTVTTQYADLYRDSIITFNAFCNFQLAPKTRKFLLQFSTCWILFANGHTCNDPFCFSQIGSDDSKEGEMKSDKKNAKSG